MMEYNIWVLKKLYIKKNIYIWITFITKQDLFSFGKYAITQFYLLI